MPCERFRRDEVPRAFDARKVASACVHGISAQEHEKRRMDSDQAAPRDQLPGQWYRVCSFSSSRRPASVVLRRSGLCLCRIALS
jgi:hypothetical protein